MSQPWYREGTITLTNGSATVTGVTTAWGNTAYVRPGDALYVKIDGVLVLVEEILEAVDDNEITLKAVWGGETIEDANYAIVYSGLIRNSVAALAYDISSFTQNLTAFISGEGPPDNGLGENGWGYIDELGPTYYRKAGGAWGDGVTLVGPAGPEGPTYSATSTTSLALSAGSKSLTTQAGKAFQIGARVRLTSAANPTTHYMEGVVTAYSSTSLSFTADRIGGSGSRADWNLNIAGEIGDKGDPGASYAAASTTSITIGTGSKAFTVAAGLAYVAGLRVRASSAANLSNHMEGVVASYSGTTLTITVDRTSGSGTLADWSIGLTGPVGATGRGYMATSVTSRTLGMGTMSFTTQENLAYTAGARARFASAADPETHYMEGVVDSYSGTAIAVTFDLFEGSGSRADWTINLAGDQGQAATVTIGTVTTLAPGADATVENVGTDTEAELDIGIPAGFDGAGYGGTSTTSLLIEVATKVFTTQEGLAYTAASRVRAASEADPSNYMDGAVVSYTDDELTIAVDFVSGSGTFADWVFSLVGTQGPAGAGSVDSVNAKPGPVIVLDGTDIAAGHTPINYDPASGGIADHLAAIDDALGSASSAGEAPDATVASGSTTDIGAAAGFYIEITGTTTINSFGTTPNVWRIVRFVSTPTLTHNATSLKLPGNVSRTAAAGDIAAFVSDDSGNWQCVGYQRASGGQDRLSVGAPVALTIASGAVTPTQTRHTVDTEASAATDDLDTINTTNASDGHILILSSATGSRDVTVKNGTGNVTLHHGDFVLASSTYYLVLILRNGTWYELTRAPMPSASETQPGLVELATDAEAIAGTDTARAVTPAGLAAALASAVSDPQGRLTLTTNTPVMSADVNGTTNVRYTPYRGRLAPLFDGSAWKMHDFGGELVQTTTDTTKSPAAVANNSNYDIFLWNDSGTYRISRGPAWSSSTSRGTGSGTTELEYVQGRLVNKQSITNGPAAQRGTYLGTIRSNGSAQIAWKFGAITAGGTAGYFGVWNYYNRVNCTTLVGESTDSWTYASTTVRQANASAGMACSIVCGMAEEPISATYHGRATNSTNGTGASGIGWNVTNAFSGTMTGVSFLAGNTLQAAMVARYADTFLGFLTVNAVEACTTASSCTFYGDQGLPPIQTGLFVEWRA